MPRVAVPYLKAHTLQYTIPDQETEWRSHTALLWKAESSPPSAFPPGAGRRGRYLEIQNSEPLRTRTLNSQYFAA